MLTADPYYDLESDVLLNEKPTSKSSNETGKNNTQVPEQKKGATKINAKKKIKKKSVKTSGANTTKTKQNEKKPVITNPMKEASNEDKVATNVVTKGATV